MELVSKTKPPVVEETFLQSVLSKRIKSTDKIKQNEYLLKIDNTNKFSKGNISGWIGLAKSKKTFALTMFVSALVGCLRLFAKFNANSKNDVLYIDTEQSPADVQRVTKRVKSIVGKEEGLFMYGLRPLSPKQRIQAIELLLKEHNGIDVLVVDGVRDLLMDINNAVESTEVMTLLMKWSFDYDIHIATVLHQNKADGNSRGHIGTELNNKAETIIRITKDAVDGNISYVEEVFGRGKGFEKFSFQISDDGLPEVIESISNSVSVDKAPWEK
ncbi:AAA domain-containing protein [Lutibacter sp. Hel_I_33_5]|uniref:AAA family ATPase n=1 Tax=Lutibacter sp. Hel_I_33_5 TaxID=1566289 RepID=UPI0011A9CFFD|nr:AAA family ATPase [Lutibacter sp. Hel_I_33_5]TVZ55619.1 AAA domain-containing protein [Lutibacter sp. Hel_I_33_5]